MLRVSSKCLLSSLALFMVLGATAAPASAGFIFFSVDVDSDKLVAIDPTTGHVSQVGALGLTHDVEDMDLAFFNGELYGISSHWFAQFAELVKINTSTGAATSIANVKFNNASQLTITYSEGLTTHNSDLYLSGTLAAFSPLSTGIGPVNSLTGVVPTGASIHLADNTLVDFDGMGTSPLGQVYGVDTIPHLQTNFIYTVDPVTGLAALVGSYSTVGVGALNDLVFAGNELYGIAHEPSRLHRINPNNGQLIETISLDSSAYFYGLEVVEVSNTVPVPSSLTMLVSLSVCGWCWHRRDRTKRKRSPDGSRIQTRSAEFGSGRVA